MTGVRIPQLTAWLAAAALLLSLSTKAQERCASQELLQIVPAAQRAYMPGGKLFEKQLRLEREASRTTDDDTAIYRVPVVVHVVHKGEQVGTGSNISMRVIESQIRKPNTNGFNTNPAGADTRIEFVLATCDSNGNPSTGVNRVLGSQQIWSLGDDAALKTSSMWPKDRYVNIWVCDVETPYLGYSTFPQVTGIPMGQMPGSYIDGVVIDYSAFGQVPNGNYNLGRTATHELGHYLGLVHVWGDIGGCSGDDFCNDTPIQEGQINFCPTTPPTPCPGQATPMIENYLQYTYDRCMRVFTNDQTYRMRYVLRNSAPRRMLRDSMRVCITPVDPTVPAKISILFSADRKAFVLEDQSVDSTSPAHLRVYSVDGRLIYEGTTQSRTMLVPLPGTMGMYLVKFERGKTRAVIRAVPFDGYKELLSN